MKILRLNLKRKWWEQIRDGVKLEELRLDTEYWRKRLENRDYNEIHLLLGYPKKGDDSKLIKRKWNGYTKKKIKHEEFGDNEKSVFAIDVTKLIET